MMPIRGTSSRRHAKMRRCEVVRVASPLFLISSRQQACRYETPDGEPLAAGYYLALWPDGSCASFHGRELTYLGPFASMAAIRLLQTSALALEIVAAGANDDHAALPPPALPGGYGTHLGV